MKAELVQAASEVITNQQNSGEHMKKLTSLLIGCSLALAGAALAQQPVEQQSPSKGKHAPEKAHPAQAQPKSNAAKPQAPPASHQGATQQHGTTHNAGATKEHGATTQQGIRPFPLRTPVQARDEHAATNEPQAPPASHQRATQQHGTTHNAGATKEHGATTQQGIRPFPLRTPVQARDEHAATNEPGAGKSANAPAHQESATSPKTDESADTSTPNARQQRVEQRRKGMKGQAPASKTSTNPEAPAAGAAPAGAAAGKQNMQANAGAKAKKPDPQKVQQIKTQHANFRAQPKPQQVPAVTFNQNYRIERSEQWQGPQYEVFRSYHPEWHEQGWYHSHYNRVELIGGGYYFWNAGYWYPAWGYSPSAQYYAYDGPIYVGHRAEPPDKVIADVQAVLQEMGYYSGEVDGLLGPMTREALTAYQADQGLTTTAVIDEPTLDSLGMS